MLFGSQYIIYSNYIYIQEPGDAKFMLHLSGETLNKFVFIMMVRVVFTVGLESPAEEEESKTLTKAKTMYRSCMDLGT